MATSCDFKPAEERSNLVKLKELTESLQFHDTVKGGSGGVKEFDLDVGTSYMVGLFKSAKMAVARVYSSAGVEFPAHVHDEWEMVIVYKGEIHLNVEGEKVILREKDFYYLKPGTSHGAYYPVESWVLCVTMPASDDFPDGG